MGWTREKKFVEEKGKGEGSMSERLERGRRSSRDGN